MRIPQQQVELVMPIPETVTVAKNRSTFKSFISGNYTCKTRKTVVWGTKKANLNDAYSYINALKMKKNLVEKKRLKKEEFKRLCMQIDQQKRFYKRDIFDNPILPQDNYHDVLETQIRLYPKPNNEDFEEKHSQYTRSTISKSIPVNKYYREDTHKAIEEAEFKSTAVSWQERQTHKEHVSKSYNGTVYNEYELDHEVPNLSSNKSNEKVYHENQIDESLLDQIFDEQNQEFSDDFMKNSLPLD
jgi:hypothetical protein